MIRLDSVEVCIFKTFQHFTKTKLLGGFQIIAFNCFFGVFSTHSIKRAPTIPCGIYKLEWGLDGAPNLPPHIAGIAFAASPVGCYVSADPCRNRWRLSRRVRLAHSNCEFVVLLK